MIIRIFWSVALSLLFTFYLSSSSGQSFFVNAGAESFSQGTSNTSTPNNWSSVNNISGIASIEEASISAAVKKYYNEVNISNAYLSAIYPLKNFTLSVLLSRQGNDYFNIQRHGIGIANKIGFANLGLQVSYIQYHAEGFGNKGSIAFDFGGTAQLNEKVIFGAHIFNFTQSSLDVGSEEPIPVITKVGITYYPIENFSISSDIEKKILAEPLFKLGLSYEIIESIHLRTGATFNPIKNFFGFGYHSHRIKFDYGFAHHSILGMTHQLSFALKLKKK